MMWNFALYVVEILDDVTGWQEADIPFSEFCHLLKVMFHFAL